MGAGWGLLSLSFIAACLSYWAARYTTSGAQEAAIAAFGLDHTVETGFGIAARPSWRCSELPD